MLFCISLKATDSCRVLSLMGRGSLEQLPAFRFLTYSRTLVRRADAGSAGPVANFAAPQIEPQAALTGLCKQDPDGLFLARQALVGLSPRPTFQELGSGSHLPGVYVRFSFPVQDTIHLTCRRRCHGFVCSQPPDTKIVCSPVRVPFRPPDCIFVRGY